MQMIQLCYMRKTEEKLLCLKAILVAFEAISGLQTLSPKSSIFPVKSEQMIQELTEIMGCQGEVF
uniref:Putative ovule protein n=1 Tax=Solanum chacoense TaxID=4108 RepID=A0A0V0H4Q0_SOLCH